MYEFFVGCHNVHKWAFMSDFSNKCTSSFKETQLREPNLSKYGKSVASSETQTPWNPVSHVGASRLPLF